MNYIRRNRQSLFLHFLFLILLPAVSVFLFSCENIGFEIVLETEYVADYMKYSVPYPLATDDSAAPTAEITADVRKEMNKEIGIAEKKAEEERLAAEKAERIANLTGYSEAFVATLTAEEQAQAQALREEGFVFYRQNWSVLNDLPYGDDILGQCGCGPTTAAEIIANLAGIPITPFDTWKIAVEMGSYIPSQGTSYYFMTTVPERYGIKATNVSLYDKEAVLEALRAGKLVLVSMGPGDFTHGAHFMLLRGITENGKILIADTYSYVSTQKEWDFEYLYAQIKNGFWIYEKEEAQPEAVSDNTNESS